MMELDGLAVSGFMEELFSFRIAAQKEARLHSRTGG